MPSNNQSRLRFDEIRTLPFGDISADYTPVGSSTNDSGRFFQVQNVTDQPVMLSFDRQDEIDHVYLPSQSFFLIDTTTNRTNLNDFYVSGGTQLLVKHMGTAPTEGAIYFTLAYGG